MIIDIYQVRRRNGETGEVEIDLNNDNFRLSRTQMRKQILETLNLNNLNITNPFVAAKFIKRTPKKQ